jgi:hypothetical protein
VCGVICHRSVQYFEQVYVKGRVPSAKAFVLREVIMHTIPNFDKGCSPYIEIFSTSKNSLISSPPQGYARVSCLVCVSCVVCVVCVCVCVLCVWCLC